MLSYAFKTDDTKQRKTEKHLFSSMISFKSSKEL